MKHLASITRLVLLGAVTAACTRPAAKPVAVTFSVGETTRADALSPEGETRVEQWALYLFRDGTLVQRVEDIREGSISVPLATGPYTAMAVANYPDSFRPSDYSTPDALAACRSDLADNRPDRLVMVGRKGLTVTEADGTQTIPVERLVAKLGIRRVRTDFADPAVAALPFSLKAVYLTNVCRQSRFGTDLTAAELPVQTDGWCNPMGYAADTGTDALLARIGPLSLTGPFVFYPYPNPASADSRQGPWSVRRTRMVLETEIGGRTYYYAITVPGIARNRTYIAEEVILRHLGSDDPEEDRPGTLEVRFSTGHSDWAPEYGVDENS